MAKLVVAFRNFTNAPENSRPNAELCDVKRPTTAWVSTPRPDGVYCEALDDFCKTNLDAINGMQSLKAVR
jgi:hypothetical protein